MTTQKARDRRREQLMSRANSLKKAIREIIEHTSKRKISLCYIRGNNLNTMHQCMLLNVYIQKYVHHPVL